MKISFDGSVPFDEFIRDNSEILFSEIEEIYNLGAFQFDEYSLFIFAKEYVFRIFFNDLVIKFDIFPKKYFLSRLENDHIFKENEKSFNYLYIPEPYKLNCKIENISMINSHKDNPYESIVFTLSDNNRLYVSPSDIVIGTMSAWIE